MSRRLTRIWLWPMLLFAGQAAALGLGDIRLSSALNEPLRAEIELLAATPEELNNLTVQLASNETFERYGLDRPLFLTSLRFDVFKTGTVSGNLVRITSTSPVTEPFVTFLVEAAWSRGRLLREYTVLLDPPTFAPPPVAQSTQTVTAPTRSTQSDAGRIQRAQEPPPPPPQSARQQSQVQPPVESMPSEPTQPSEPVTAQPVRETFDPAPGGEIRVQRGDTLWNIAQRVRPDDRLTMNQTMIGIFEANPDAFAGNINLLSAGASLRIPSADDMFNISRGEALSAAKQHHDAWSAGDHSPIRTQPSLTLVPPDEDQTGYDDSVSTTDTGYSREFEIEDRIIELEADVPDQSSLLEIRNNELAQLRAELARLRGEEPPELPIVDDESYADSVDDEMVVDDADTGLDDDPDQVFVDDEGSDAGLDDAVTDDTGTDDADSVTDATTTPTTPVVSAPAPKPSLMDTILGYVMSVWGAIAGAIVLVLGILIWFARRAGREDEDSTGVWNTLDSDDIHDDVHASTENLRALAREDDTAIVVVEQESKAAMAAEMAGNAPRVAPTVEPIGDDSGETGTQASLEDTFSSETAINLDQSDPIAEADFHMAYGLHDQAADLINGALEVEPGRQDLLAKLCEVYFVWGNRDAFIDAAQKMSDAVGDTASAEWGKIVIMGQQIAADHELFSGKSAGEATKAVDLSLDGALDQTSALDLDFAGGQDGEVSQVIDLGAESGEFQEAGAASGIDFSLDENDTSEFVTQEMPSGQLDEVFEDTHSQSGLDDDTAETSVSEDVFEDTQSESGLDDDTAETPAAIGESTVETPTIEQQFDSFDATGQMSKLTSLADDDATELASLDDETDGPDDTAEIDLDDLGLDLDALTKTGLAEDLADEDEPGATEYDPDATSENEALNLDSLAATGRNPQLGEMDESGATGLHAAADIQDQLDETGEREFGSSDATGRNPLLPDIEALSEEDDDLGVDTSLLDATGQTQILSDDFAVATAADVDDLINDDDDSVLVRGLGDDYDDTIAGLPDDAETLLAPLDDDDADDFDFAKTEALPKDVFTGEASIDETGELPSFAGSTDMDLDLDDLTAALRVSEVGDTVNQARDDATVEQPRIRRDQDLDLDADDEDAATQAMSPDEVADDLHDARTMTEVGTKLDLARAYVDMGDPGGARSILEEVLDEGDDSQRQQAQQLLDSLPA